MTAQLREGMIKNRIYNFETRGIAKANIQSFEELFRERQVLYKNILNLPLIAMY